MKRRLTFAAIVFTAVIALGFVGITYADKVDVHNTDQPTALKIPPKLKQTPAEQSLIFGAPVTAPSFKQENISVQKRAGGTIPLTAEIARTPQEQARGLMFRTELADNKGMLFIFPDIAQRNFWMKNTLIPLDMLFLDADGTIHHIHENAVPQDLSRVTSRQPAKAVLELAGGAAKRLGIATGDRIEHTSLKPEE